MDVSALNNLYSPLEVSQKSWSRLKRRRVGSPLLMCLCEGSDAGLGAQVGEKKNMFQSGKI